MALIGGFYNSKMVDGAYDRPYHAKDLRKPYDVIYTDGIKPDPDGTVGDNFKVTAVSGYTIRIATGHAKLGGAWIENDSIIELNIDSPNSASSRYDMIMLINDEVERKPVIQIVSSNTEPTSVEKTVANGYQVCLAYIPISPTTASITDNIIVDTREKNAFCGVMSGVGATVLRSYRSTYYTKSTYEQNIPINIPEYDGTFRSDLTVLVEGMVASGYRISSDFKTVILPSALPVAGTRIDFHVTKNVNGSTAGDVVMEVAELNNRVAIIEDRFEHHYYCNGVNDNIEISNLVRGYYSYSNYSSVKLVIHGTMGINTAARGSGTSSNQYGWFNFYSASKPTCRVIVDFSDCSAINIPMTNSTYNVVFYGAYVDVYGAVVIAKNQNARVVVNNSYAETGCYFKAEKCHFDLVGLENSSISYMGDIVNCYGRVANTLGHTWCFDCKKLVRVFGGEFLAYHKNDGIGAIMYNENNNACGVMVGVNCPEITLSGYSQDSVYSSYTDSDKAKIKEIATITRLPAYVTLPNDDWDIIDPELEYNMA